MLELCGLASFSPSTVELRSFFTNFHRHYNLEIAYPKIIYLSPEEMLSSSISRVFEKICMKMNYLDAQILLIAEEHDCSAFATWNKTL